MILYISDTTYIDTSKPIDISMPLRASKANPTAWYVDPPRFEPVRTEHYTGSVAEGGDVNFRDIYFNPHGHGTHTECLGHITKEVYSINETLNHFFFSAKVISILPKRLNRTNDQVDFVITLDQLKMFDITSEALIIRTLPNDSSKLERQYSNTNPPYLDVDCAKYLIECGVEHLLVDIPSVDKESDGGKLAFHHAFWEVPLYPNFKRTITELIYVANHIKDGDFILNMQVAPFQNDAAPSRPVLYKILEK
jgi:kynurenine formamidase